MSLTEKMRLGIYGGTFNPPHKGHIEAAEAFAREMRLDKLMIIPTFIPPHKSESEEITPELRLQMCRLAFSHIPNTEVSDMEIKRGGRSYTYLTLDELKKDDTELFFLCGTDMILTFDLWKNYEYIFTLAAICYIRREADSSNSLKIKEKTEQYKKIGANVIEIKHTVREISSTDIRSSIVKLGDEHLTTPVLDFIKMNGIYLPIFSESDLSSIRHSVKDLMSERRYLHTLGVENAAVRIAKSVAPWMSSRAAAAAILHDVTKEMSQSDLIMKYDIPLTAEDLYASETLHALTAAEYIKENFEHFAYPDILFAVRSHTVGDPCMTLLGKILFVADYIEEGRKYDSSVKLREELYSALDSAKSREQAISALNRAVISSIDYTTAHLLSIGAKPHTKTSQLRDAISKTRGQ